MSTDTGGRAVLRPAGNVTRSNLRKASKPLPPPIKPPLNPSSKISPPNSLLSTPKPPTRTHSFKPNSSPSKLSPHKPPSLSTVCLARELSTTSLHLESDGPKPAAAAGGLRPGASEFPRLRSDFTVCEHEFDGYSPSFRLSDEATPSGSEPSSIRFSSSTSDLKPTSNENNLSGTGSGTLSALGQKLQDGSKSSTDVLHACGSRTQKVIDARIVLTKSTSEVSQRSSGSCKVKSKPSNKKSLNKLGSLSFDESSLASMITAKKEAAKQLSQQRKQKASEYGRKQGKASRVAPEVPSAETSHLVEPQRCRFITAQSDPSFVDYHDKEWGVPVHDDRPLFERLTLAGFQVELNWTAILHRRDAYRSIFAGFDPAAVSLFREKHINSLEADKSLGLPYGKVGGVVNNARKILEVALEFGSLDEYLWGFVNRQPMINNYRYPKQVPVKTSKAEFISKDLVKRGFRFVGPTIIYSFMQASGMTNDHLVQCFRHRECTELVHLFGANSASTMSDGTTQYNGLASPMHHLNFVLEDDAEHGDSCGECHLDQQLEKCTKAAG